MSAANSYEAPVMPPPPRTSPTVLTADRIGAWVASRGRVAPMLIRRLNHPVDLPGLLDLFDRCDSHDGQPPLSEHKHAALTAGRLSGDGFVAEDDGKYVGYVHFLESKLTGTYELEIAVNPSNRGGVEEVLLPPAIDSIRALGGHKVVAWAYRPGAELPLEAAGFVLERTLHQLRVALPAADPVRAGLHVRGFKPADTTALLHLNNRAFEGHMEAGNWTPADLRVRQAYDWYRPDGIRMLWEGENLVAFCWTKQHPQHLGEIYLVAVDPDMRGHGFGRQAVLEGLHFLHLHGSTEGMLYADAANRPALRLYQQLGFVKHHRDHALGLQLR